MSEKKSSRIAIIVALIGALGIIITAIINKIDTKNNGSPPIIQNEINISNEIGDNSVLNNGNTNETIYPIDKSDDSIDSDKFDDNINYSKTRHELRTKYQPPVESQSIILTIENIEGGQVIRNAKIKIEGMNDFYSNEHGEAEMEVSLLRQKYGEFGSVNASVYHPDYEYEKLVIGLSESQKLKLYPK